MIETISFTGLEEGFRLLILGAVHGNEKCGTKAIRRVLEDFAAERLAATHGRVTFVPVCNPMAYEADQRFIDRNLNRFLEPVDFPDGNEEKIGNVLCPLLADCDVLLDLHSYTVGGMPFAFAEAGDKGAQSFAARIGAEWIVTGWQQAYAASGAAADPKEAMGTESYARRAGAIAVTLECGQHRDPESEQVAYRAIHAALRYYGITEAPLPFGDDVKLAKLVDVKNVFYRDREGRLAREWKHMDKVANGEPLAHYDDGAVLSAPGDGYVIMPRAQCPLGEEWFYFGTG